MEGGEKRKVSANASGTGPQMSSLVSIFRVTEERGKSRRSPRDIACRTSGSPPTTGSTWRRAKPTSRGARLAVWRAVCSVCWHPETTWAKASVWWRVRRRPQQSTMTMLRGARNGCAQLRSGATSSRRTTGNTRRRTSSGRSRKRTPTPCPPAGPLRKVATLGPPTPHIQPCACHPKLKDIRIKVSKPLIE